MGNVKSTFGMIYSFVYLYQTCTEWLVWEDWALLETDPIKTKRALRPPQAYLCSNWAKDLKRNMFTEQKTRKPKSQSKNTRKESQASMKAQL